VGDLFVCGQLAVVLEDKVAGGALHLSQAQALQVVRQLRHRQERSAAFPAFPALLPRGGQKVLGKENSLFYNMTIVARLLNTKMLSTCTEHT
jgi:hypothetical protein